MELGRGHLAPCLIRHWKLLLMGTLPLPWEDCFCEWLFLLWTSWYWDHQENRVTGDKEGLALKTKRWKPYENLSEEERTETRTWHCCPLDLQTTNVDSPITRICWTMGHISLLHSYWLHNAVLAGLLCGSGQRHWWSGWCLASAWLSQGHAPNLAQSIHYAGCTLAFPVFPVSLPQPPRQLQSNG